MFNRKLIEFEVFAIGKSFVIYLRSKENCY